LDVIYTASLLRLFAQAQPFDEYLLTKFSVAHGARPLTSELSRLVIISPFVLTQITFPKSISAQTGQWSETLKRPRNAEALHPRRAATKIQSVEDGWGRSAGVRFGVFSARRCASFERFGPLARLAEIDLGM